MTWKRMLGSILGIALLFSGCGPDGAGPPPVTLAPVTEPPEPNVVPQIVDELSQYQTPKVAVFFLVDWSDSVRRLCPKEQQDVRYIAPAMTLSLLRGLSYHGGDSEWPKMGLTAFTSQVHISPFSLQSVSTYPDTFVNQYDEYVGPFARDDGNDFPEALSYGENILLQETDADRKILVLITDGWFIFDSKNNWRQPTRDNLDALKKSGIEVLLLRLQCPDPQSVYATHNVDQQNTDNELWGFHVKLDNILGNKDEASLLKSMFEHPLFSSLLPSNKRIGWWNSADGSNIPIKDILGDTWNIKIGLASWGADEFDFKDENGFGANVSAQWFGVQQIYLEIPISSPTFSCQDYTGYLQPKQKPNPNAYFFYWWISEGLGAKFHPSGDVINSLAMNKEPFKVHAVIDTNLKNDVINNFSPCYEIWVSLVKDEHSKFAFFQKRIELAEALGDHTWELPIEYLNEYQDFKILVDLVAFPESKERFSSMGRWQSHIVSARFRPTLDEQSRNNNCAEIERRYECKISFLYMHHSYYPSGKDIVPEIWVLSELSYEEINASDTCNEFDLPHVDFQVSNNPKWYPIPLYSPSLEIELPSQSDNVTVIIDEGNITIMIDKVKANECGLNTVIVQWEKPEDLTRDYWQMIECPLKGGGCKESPINWVVLR